MMLSGMVLMQLWYRFSVSKATRWQTSEGTSASRFFDRSAERQERTKWVYYSIHHCVFRSLLCPKPLYFLCSVLQHLLIFWNKKNNTNTCQYDTTQFNSRTNYSLWNDHRTDSQTKAAPFTPGSADTAAEKLLSEARLSSVFGRGAEVRRSRPGLVTPHPAVSQQQQHQQQPNKAEKCQGQLFHIVLLRLNSDSWKHILFC